MDFNSIVDEQLKAIKPYFEKQLKKSFEDTANGIINNLFRNPREVNQWNKDSNTSIMYERVMDAITERFLNENNQQKINEYIDKHWDILLEEATKKALQHQANKLAFKTVEKMKNVNP